MSPCRGARGSVTSPLPFSSNTSMPLVKLTMRVFSAASTALVRAAVTLVSLKSTSDVHGLAVQVFMTRAAVVNGADALLLLPLRRTSAAPPFSTTPPSGKSLNVLFATLVQVPALAGENVQ